MHTLPETTEQINYADEGEVTRWATRTVRTANRRAKTTRQEQIEHWRDMVQTAIVTLYDCRDKPLPIAYNAAVYDVISYIACTIWQTTGNAWRWYDGDTKGARTYYFEEMQPDHEAYDDDVYGRFLHPDLRKSGPYRPVETEVVTSEQAEAQSRFWRQVERELLYVLAGMKVGQYHPDALMTAARVLCLSLQGLSHAAIALEVGKEPHEVWHIRDHYRNAIEAFLAMGPVQQGLVRAEGQARIYHYQEPDEAVLNAGKRFIAILPNGAFSVSVRGRRGQSQKYATLQYGYRVNGKVKMVGKQVGPVGQVTYDRLYDGAQVLRAKLATARVAAGD
ncbi:MAG: hypothetical protein L0332_30790 [Chloroflexi bacterium]|nr:hypothetical protein [Chloroflexota bacterium]MCI0648017.1 hypothetical protein [Chloroflexota bacterium]MCI0731087.1 hypothetical protein [Chloroflexota bacterium]